MGWRRWKARDENDCRAENRYFLRLHVYDYGKLNDLWNNVERTATMVVTCVKTNENTIQTPVARGNALHFQIFSRFGISQQQPLLRFLLVRQLLHRSSIPNSILFVHHPQYGCLGSDGKGNRFKNKIINWSLLIATWSEQSIGATDMSRTARKLPQLFKCSFSSRK